MKPTQTYEEAVTKIVLWWVEKSFLTTQNQNNGDKTDIGGFTSVMLNMVANRVQVTTSADQIKKFTEKLTELLLNADQHNRSLHVDYHPEGFLEEAAVFAGIDTHCFPVKSSTRIDENNRAYAKYQYGASMVEI